jgi:hypothetical protein
VAAAFVDLPLGTAVAPGLKSLDTAAWRRGHSSPSRHLPRWKLRHTSAEVTSASPADVDGANATIATGFSLRVCCFGAVVVTGFASGAGCFAFAFARFSAVNTTGIGCLPFGCDGRLGFCASGTFSATPLGVAFCAAKRKRTAWSYLMDRDGGTQRKWKLMTT